MSSLALSVLSLTLGLFFILIGQFKVTPKFFPEIYEDMVRILILIIVFLKFILFNQKYEFGRINKVFPFYHMIGWRPYAKNYRMTIGIIEIICGAILVLIPG